MAADCSSRSSNVCCATRSTGPAAGWPRSSSPTDGVGRRFVRAVGGGAGHVDEPGRVEGGGSTFVSDELVVGAELDDTPVLDHGEAIAAHGRGETAGADDGRAAAEERVD